MLEPLQTPGLAMPWPVLAAAITVGGALAVFTLTKLTELFVAFAAVRRRRSAFIRALFAEIDFNAAELTVFNNKAPSLKRLTAALEEDRDRIPHITDARHTLIYRRNVDDISFLDDSIVKKVVQFYGDLEKLKVQIDGLQLTSFRTISAQGKIDTILEIYETSRRAARAGAEIMEQMRRRYAALKLQSDGRALLPPGDLQAGSEFDGIGSGHGASPDGSPPI